MDAKDKGVSTGRLSAGRSKSEGLQAWQGTWWLAFQTPAWPLEQPQGYSQISLRGYGGGGGGGGKVGRECNFSQFLYLANFSYM